MEKIDVSLLKIVKDNDWSNTDLGLKLNQLIWWLERPFISKIGYTTDYEYNDQGGHDIIINFNWFIIRKGFEEEFLDYLISLDVELTAALCYLTLKPLKPSGISTINDSYQIQSDCLNDLNLKLNYIYELNDVNFYTKQLKTEYPEVYQILLEIIKYITTYEGGIFSDDNKYCCFILDDDYAIDGLFNEEIEVFANEKNYFDKYPEIDEIKALINCLWLRSTNISNSLQSIIDQW